MEELKFAVVAVPSERVSRGEGGEVVITVFDTSAEAEAAVLVANGIDPDWDYRVSMFLP